jgi:glucosamine--fructose-6-phosphate aminotransferase (isomerizing)
MCCVVGYVGQQQSRALVIDGLSRLEYRGYDSAGFACVSQDTQTILSVKALGGVNRLMQNCTTSPIDGFLGVGHTRWSTHGAVTLENAHPVFDCRSATAIVHNGIIENHHELREQLVRQGHALQTETDSEVIAHLIERELEVAADIKAAMLRVVNQLDGAYACIGLLQAHPEFLVAIRKRSPLCIGIGEGGMFVASDQLAFAGKVQRVAFLPDASFAFVYKDHIELYDFAGNLLEIESQPLTLVWESGGKQGFEHYMLKEIYEQKRVVADTVATARASVPLLDVQLGVSYEYLREIEQIVLIGCGTSWHASRIAQYFFESLCKVPVTVGLASEFKYQENFIAKKAICIAISQSGETADTLESVRLLNARGVPTVALTNVASSSMVREAGGFILTQAGQEIAVASTKSFTAQIASLFLLAHQIAVHKGLIKQAEVEFAGEELLVAAELLEKSIEQYKPIINESIAPFCASFSKSIFLGRHLSYVFAQEAALKLKEIAYIFAEAYPAGELKHGPIALVDNHTPVFVFSVLDPLIYQKLVSNAQEVKSRGGYLIAFVFEGQTELIKIADRVFIFSPVHPMLAPVAMAGVMQYLVYQIANVLNLPIDKPRNLAKSVTVE